MSCRIDGSLADLVLMMDFLGFNSSEGLLLLPDMTLGRPLISLSYLKLNFDFTLVLFKDY